MSTPGTGRRQPWAFNISTSLIIGGSTSSDDSDTALIAIMSEWSSTSSFADRVNNIRGTGKVTRKNGSNFFNQDTILDDAMADALTGGSDADWFWLAGGDVITDQDAADKRN